MALRVLILLFILAIDAAHAILTNITVDDTDTSVITYKGAWDPFASHQSTLDFGGSHAFSSDEGASATLGFSGVAVYYLAPRWPYAVSSRISLDGGEAVLVNLTDLRASPTPEGGSESAVWSVAWFADGLTQEPHEVVVSIGNYIIVDGFICTVDNGTASSSVSASSSSSSASASSSSSSSIQSQSSSSSQSASSTFAVSSESSGVSTSPSHANHSITIGLATGLGLATLLAAGILLFAWIRRSRQQRRHSLRPKPCIDDEDEAASMHMWTRTRRFFGGGARGVYGPPLQELSRPGLISAYPYSMGPPPLALNQTGDVNTNLFTDPWEQYIELHSPPTSYTDHRKSDT